MNWNYLTCIKSHFSLIGERKKQMTEKKKYNLSERKFRNEAWKSNNSNNANDYNLVIGLNSWETEQLQQGV